MVYTVKLQQKEVKMDCSKCIFAIASPEQEGCKVGRLETLIQKGKAVKDGDFYKLSQFCNLYRDKNWDGGSDPEAKAKEQAKTSFGIGVFDDLSETTEELNNTLELLAEAITNYDTTKVYVVLSLSSVRKPEDIVSLAEKLKSKNIYCEAIAHRFLFDDKIRETEVFQKISSFTYMTKLKGGDKIKKSVFTDVNQSIFYDLDQFICFQSEDAVILHQNIIKSEYFNYKNFDEMASTIRDFCSEKGVLGLI